MSEHDYSAPGASVSALMTGDGQDACRIAVIVDLRRVRREIEMRRNSLESLSDVSVGMQMALNVIEERLTEIGGEW